MPKREPTTVRVTSISMVTTGEVLYTPETGYTVSEAAGTRIARSLLSDLVSPTDIAPEGVQQPAKAG